VAVVDDDGGAGNASSGQRQRHVLRGFLPPQHQTVFVSGAVALLGVVFDRRPCCW
jgi:hypothetical protein